MKGGLYKVPDNSSFYIRTRCDYGDDKELCFNTRQIDQESTKITISCSNWRIKVKNCLKDSDKVHLQNVPNITEKVWKIFKDEKNVVIWCNGVKVFDLSSEDSVQAECEAEGLTGADYLKYFIADSATVEHTMDKGLLQLYHCILISLYYHTIISLYYYIIISYHYIISSLYHYIIISLHHYIIISLYHCIIISLYHYIIASLYHYIIISLYHCIIISLYHYIIASLYHYIIISLYHIIISFHHYIIISLYHCIIISLYYYIII